jgi:hypothetical protein
MTPPDMQNDLAKIQCELDEAKKETVQIREEIDYLRVAERNRLQAQQAEQIKGIEETLRLLKNPDDSKK